MPLSLLLAIILVIAVVGYVLGRQRALASAGGDAASKVPAMDGTMMGEVARTASKIGHDIGDGVSVPNGVRHCPDPALLKPLC